MFFLFNLFSSSLPNGVYYLKNNVSPEIYPAYCFMNETLKCGAGGWTLAVKIDGYMQLCYTLIES